MGLARACPHLLLCCLAAFGCASGGARSDDSLHEEHLPGTWHVVAQGETSASIAQQAGIPLDDFLEINGLRKNETLVPGRPVFLLASPASGSAATATATTAPAGAGAPASKAPLRWPVASPRLSSPFGTRGGRDHDGLDRAAPRGTPVYAAAGGAVIYAGDQVRGYGNMIVVQHVGGLVTVYAHNSVLLVHTGDKVNTGQEIARVGDTGRSTAPHLHFEVRRGENPQDPMQFLPALK